MDGCRARAVRCGAIPPDHPLFFAVCCVDVRLFARLTRTSVAFCLSAPPSLPPALRPSLAPFPSLQFAHSPPLSLSPPALARHLSWARHAQPPEHHRRGSGQGGVPPPGQCLLPRRQLRRCVPRLLCAGPALPPAGVPRHLLVAARRRALHPPRGGADQGPLARALPAAQVLARQAGEPPRPGAGGGEGAPLRSVLRIHRHQRAVAPRNRCRAPRRGAAGCGGQPEGARGPAARVLVGTGRKSRRSILSHQPPASGGSSAACVASPGTRGAAF